MVPCIAITEVKKNLDETVKLGCADQIKNNIVLLLCLFLTLFPETYFSLPLNAYTRSFVTSRPPFCVNTDDLTLCHKPAGVFISQVRGGACQQKALSLRFARLDTERGAFTILLPQHYHFLIDKARLTDREKGAERHTEKTKSPKAFSQESSLIASFQQSLPLSTL